MNPTRRRVRATLFIGSAALAVAVATSALAVDVTGRVEVPSGFGATSSDSEGRDLDYYWQEWAGVLAPRTPAFDPARELAVVLIGSGSASGEEPPLRFHGGDLMPRTLVARAGGRLSIRNDDSLPHEIFAEGHPELGGPSVPTAPGNAREVSVASAGHWVVRDRAHPHVEGHLHVVDDLVARAELTTEGRFVFRGVEPGTYTLKIFHREREVGERSVEVPEGRELTVDPIRVAAPE